MIDELEREKNPDHVARGLKAAIHNPNVSLDAKVHAVQELEKMGREPPSDSPAQQTAEGGDLNRDNVDREDSEKDSKHKHHVLGGYKATMKSKS